MILCCGEALIDFMPVNASEGPAYAPHAGGSICNVAVGLARLGRPAGLMGGVSADFFGDMIVDKLRDAGADLTHTVRTAQPATLAFVKLGGDEPEYAFYDEGAADRMWTASDAPLGAEVSALHFGSLGLLREPAASAYLAVMRREAGQRVITLDPNLRPGMVEDEAAYRAALDEALSLADIIKISAADLEWLRPDAAHSDVAKAWLTDGAKAVVITRGADGAVAFVGDETIEQPVVPAPNFVDAVGAGDSFMSGLLAGLDTANRLAVSALPQLSTAELAEAVRLAASAASITVSRRGANPPRLGELEL